MSFAQFMQLALYDPTVGYYRRHQDRVGYGPDTDYFTASTSTPVYGDLVSAACVSLLDGKDPGEFTFVEIGAEPAIQNGAATQGILADREHPFAAVQTITLEQPLRISGPCVVFSNELFDAQPFHRFVFRQGSWRELGVRLHDGALSAVELSVATAVPLPDDGMEGYVIDAPCAARALAEQIAREPWTGLFVAADYGKSWGELIEGCPEGTGRAYFRHTQSNDLLARPGEQDLTCHVCWDWLSAALVLHGFGDPQIETQESFFLHRAGGLIAATTAAEAAHFSPKKLSLLQLLHPAHLGQKFQVLHASR